MLQEIKKYNKLNERLRAKEEERKENERQASYKRDFIHNALNNKDNNLTIEEIREQANKIYNETNEEETKKLYNDIELLRIESNLIYNNIILLMYKQYNNSIIETLKKYQNKAIGEKTKEKLQNDVKEIFIKDFKDYDVFIHFSNNFDWYEKEKQRLSIEIRKKDNMYFEDYESEYIFEEIKESNYNIKVGKRYYCNIVYGYNNYKTMIYKHEEENEDMRFNYIDNTKAKAKEIVKETSKNKKALEEIKEKARKLAHDNNEVLDSNFIKYDIQDVYKIDYNISIY